MTKIVRLPNVASKTTNAKPALPYNGTAVAEKGFSFSFSCFDRSHKLFTLGDNTKDGTVSGKWFLDLLDCLKIVNSKTIAELKTSMYDLHPIDWTKANTQAPPSSAQCEYWQFRINKSKGRVIGFFIDDVFYIVWLDPHHNLTNSEGYRGIEQYRRPLSTYENQQNIILHLKQQITYLEGELQTAESLLNIDV